MKRKAKFIYLLKSNQINEKMIIRFLTSAWKIATQNERDLHVTRGIEMNFIKNWRKKFSFSLTKERKKNNTQIVTQIRYFLKFKTGTEA